MTQQQMSGFGIQQQRFRTGCAAWYKPDILVLVSVFSTGLWCRFMNYFFCASTCRKEARIFSQTIGLLIMLTKFANMSGKKTVPPWAFLEESLWSTLSEQLMISVERHHFWVFYIQIVLLQSREDRWTPSSCPNIWWIYVFSTILAWTTPLTGQ